MLDFTGQTPEQEDYEHFQYLFSLYKDRLGLGLNNALLLGECLAMVISRAIVRSYGDEMKNQTKDQLFRAISTTCVTKQTLQARDSELYKIKQESCQSVQNFLAALKWKARLCSMRVKCSRLTCKRSIDMLDTDQSHAAVSDYKRELFKPKLSSKECRNCGEKRHKSKDECAAAENKCPCGITGHFKKYCFTGGKSKKQKEDKKD